MKGCRVCGRGRGEARFKAGENICLTCQNAKNRAYYQSNQEESAAKAQANYARRMQDADTRARLAESRRAHYEANRSSLLDYGRRHYQANRERYATLHRLWQQTHPAARRAIEARWRENHRDRLFIYNTVRQPVSLETEVGGAGVGTVRLAELIAADAETPEQVVSARCQRDALSQFLSSLLPIERSLLWAYVETEFDFMAACHQKDIPMQDACDYMAHIRESASRSEIADYLGIRESDSLALRQRSVVGRVATLMLPYLRGLPAEDLQRMAAELDGVDCDPFNMSDRRYVICSYSTSPLHGFEIAALMVAIIWLACGENSESAAPLLAMWPLTAYPCTASHLG